MISRVKEGPKWNKSKPVPLRLPKWIWQSKARLLLFVAKMYQMIYNAIVFTQETIGYYIVSYF